MNYDKKIIQEDDGEIESWVGVGNGVSSDNEVRTNTETNEGCTSLQESSCKRGEQLSFKF